MFVSALQEEAFVSDVGVRTLQQWLQSSEDFPVVFIQP